MKYPYPLSSPPNECGACITGARRRSCSACPGALRLRRPSVGGRDLAVRWTSLLDMIDRLSSVGSSSSMMSRCADGGSRDTHVGSSCLNLFLYTVFDNGASLGKR